MSRRIELVWCPNGHTNCANAAPDVPDYMPDGQLCWPCAKSLIAALKDSREELVAIVGTLSAELAAAKERAA